MLQVEKDNLHDKQDRLQVEQYRLQDELDSGQAAEGER